MSEVAASVRKRRLPPFRYLILLALWVVFILWMAANLLSGSGGDFEYPSYSAYPIALFALDLWGMIGRLTFGLVIFKRQALVDTWSRKTSN